MPILRRRSRDGFDSSEFHKLCDGSCNKLTLNLDRNGFIFGGFTPMASDMSDKVKYGRIFCTFVPTGSLMSALESDHHYVKT
jgi:hypothetical protein